MAADRPAIPGEVPGTSPPSSEAASSRVRVGEAALEGARLSRTASQVLEERNAFLARASLALGASLESHAVLRTTVDLAVPRLGDFCWLELIADDRSVRRVSCAHGDPSLSAALTSLLGPIVLEPGSPAGQARATGKPQVGELARPYVAWSRGTREADVLETLQPQLYLVLPLTARGRVIGLLTLFSTGDHKFTVDEFTTAGEFARRVASALDNALLYEGAVRAQAAAEAAQEQFRHLVNGLRESEDKYRTLFEESRDAIYMTRLDGQFIDANPAAVELFGYSRIELLRLNAHGLYANVQDRDRFRREIEKNGSVRDFEVTLLRKDGTARECLISAIVRRSDAGDIVGYQGVIHDITGRKLAERRLQASEHFTRTIISSVRQGIIVYDRELTIQVWNRFMEEMTGLTAEQVVGRTARDLLPSIQQEGVEQLLRRALNGLTVQAADTELRVPQTGRTSWVSTVYSPHIGPGGDVIGVVSIVLDITERKRAEDQLMHNAFHDTLTGLPNRALFVDRLERLLKHTDRHPEYVFGVAFLDLDRFKVVNDSLGHLVGDELLVSIARRLESCTRQGDTVARLGGDEFAVLLDEVGDVSDATRVAERVLAEFSEPFRLSGHEVFTNASIGIALSSTGYQRPEDILRDADTAMYRAKLDGRARYEVFDRNMHEKAVQLLQIETDLRRALERQEFVLHYQPIISLEQGRVSGFEALLRWQHPRRGMVSPTEFIPLAEETGLIVPIGWWVLEDACRQLRTWNEQYRRAVPLSVSVNLSTKQFVQPDLLQQVDGILERTGFEASNLKLEITESAVIEHEETVMATLLALRERGIQLCIDDFGTGYSSLSYLHAFPIDTLKIDRSFVGQIGYTGANPKLVETIVALSRNLGMDAVAEGVETDEQLAFLRRIGPQFAQGFLFAAALSPAEVEELLTRDPCW